MSSRVAEDQYATKEPVPKHLRHPRRGYDETGRELKPVTVEADRRNGTTTVAIYCEACPHSAIISTDGLPDEFPIPDIATLLRCSACGSRKIRVMMDMQAHYAQCHAQGAAGAPLPASYRVDGAPFVKRSASSSGSTPTAGSGHEPVIDRRRGAHGLLDEISSTPITRLCVRKLFIS